MNPKITVIPYPRTQQQQNEKSPVRRFSAKLWQNMRKLLQILLQRDGWLINLVAFLLGRVSILGEISPCGLAFFAAVASVNRERAVGVAIWALIGLFSEKTVPGGLAAAGAYILFFRFMHGGRVRPEKKLVAYPVLIFICLLTTRMITATIFNQTLYGYLLALFDAAITLVLTLIFLYGAPMVTNREIGRTLSSEEMISMVVLLAAVAAGVPHIIIQGVAVDHVCGRLIIMILAFIGGGSMGATVGVAVGVVSSLSESSIFAGIGSYAFSGLLAGLFRIFGKWGVGLGFVAGNLILSLSIGQSAEIIYSLTETVMAALMLLLLPKKWISAVRQMVPATGVDKEYSDSRLREISLQKLANFANVFSEMAVAFSECGVKVQHGQEDLSVYIIGGLGDKLCVACEKRHHCWERDFEHTYTSLTEVLAAAENGESISVHTLPDYLKSNCHRAQELAGAINLLLERQQAYSYWQRKIQETRGMVTEQMRALAAILHNFAGELKHDQFVNNDEMVQIIQKKSEELGYGINEIQVVGDGDGPLQIDIYKQPCRGNQECVNNIVSLLNNLLDKRFVLRRNCARESRHSNCRLKLTTEERFYLISGIATAAKDPSGVLGDTYAIMPLQHGKIAVILSDGMGVGSKAAQQSATTIHLLRQLMAVGFDLAVAVKTVNSLLLLHTPEETFATVDLVVIDLYSGDADFLKIGSAPSFIKRVREVSAVRSTSLPIGIINRLEIETTKRQLATGDLIIMVTDGILDVEKKNFEKEEWVMKTLRRIATDNPREIADILLRQAKSMTSGEIIDDMTVLVLRLEEKLRLHK